MKKRKKRFIVEKRKNKKFSTDYPILEGIINISNSGFGFFSVDENSEFYEDWNVHSVRSGSDRRYARVPWRHGRREEGVFRRDVFHHKR